MNYTQHPSNTRVLGAPKGWDQGQLTCGALPVSDAEVNGVPVIVSFWRHSPEEVAAIANGALVTLWVYGGGMQPVAIGVEHKS